jgi:hypothetical protein
MDLFELLQHSTGCLSHVGAVGFHIVDQFYHFACLALHLMHHAVDFQGINTQQAHSVAENVQIVLVVSLTLVHQSDLQLFLSLIFAAINHCLEPIIVARIFIRIFIHVKVVCLSCLSTFDFRLWSVF